jgi:hypothetical protein
VKTLQLPDKRKCDSCGRQRFLFNAVFIYRGREGTWSVLCEDCYAVVLVSASKFLSGVDAPEST